MIFQFQHVNPEEGAEDYWSARDWKLTELKQNMPTWQILLSGQMVGLLCSHKQNFTFQ